MSEAEAFNRALVDFLRRQPRRDQPAQPLLDRIDDDTPADAAAFLRARAEPELPYVPLGWRGLEDEDGTVGGVIDAMGIDPDAAPWLDDARSLILGQSIGGEITLAAHGGRPQRLLWANTRTKNPAYRHVKYVDALIVEGTINTVPVETFDVDRDHGKPAPRVEEHLDEAWAVLGRLLEVIARQRMSALHEAGAPESAP